MILNRGLRDGGIQGLESIGLKLGDWGKLGN